MPTKPAKPSARRAPAAKKPSGGRPPVAPEQRRDVLTRVLTTAAEHDELQRAASAAGAPLSTWARLKLLEAARQG